MRTADLGLIQSAVNQVGRRRVPASMSPAAGRLSALGDHAAGRLRNTASGRVQRALCCRVSNLQPAGKFCGKTEERRGRTVNENSNQINRNSLLL